MGPIVSRVLTNRSVTMEDIKERELNKTHSYSDMLKACSILREASKDAEILILGDYDTDGELSTYVLVRGLREYGFKNVGYKIPNRENDGYGVSDNIIKYVISMAPDIVITCDNGISAVDRLKLLEDAGITVIVTDHHAIPEGLDTSSVSAIINPHLDYKSGLFQDFCGTAVAYLLIANLSDNKELLSELLPFVAIATICDSMPLVKENRYIVKEGLRLLPYITNIPLKEMVYSLGITPKEVTTYTFGFGIGPRLNAPGRLADANMVVDFLLEDDVFKIHDKLEEINKLNKIRQELTEAGVASAMELLEGRTVDSNRVLGVVVAGIHPGVIGIVASKLQDKYNCPTIVITDKPKTTYFTGSARSVDGFDIYANLILHADKCRTFGGHPGAAGLTIEWENVPKYLKEIQKIGFLHIDTNKPLYCRLGTITEEDVVELKELEPFGEGNPKPRFTEQVDVDYVMIREKVIKFRNGKLNYTCFNGLPDLKQKLTELNVVEGSTRIKCELEYYPTINEFNGRRSVEAIITKVASIRR